MKSASKLPVTKGTPAAAKKPPAKAPAMHPAAKNLGKWLHPKKTEAKPKAKR